jgi:hypothetical protein
VARRTSKNESAVIFNMKGSIMLVIYEGKGEIFFSSKKDEKQMIKEFFTEGDRDIDEYDRTVDDFALIESRSPSVRVFHK